MQQQHVKEMFAVVFTFIVMGVIGFSIYEPDDSQSIEDESKSLVQNQLATDTSQQAVIE